MYQPKTGQPCTCKRGVQRDNCPTCEGTGHVIDFAAIRARNRPIFATSYCNFGHDLKTGRPIAHECYVIPPRLLQAERDLPFEEAIQVWEPWYRNKGNPVKGR